VEACVTFKEVREWSRHEFVEILKQTAAILFAFTTIGGFVFAFWNYFNLPTMVSMSKHTEDVLKLRNDTEKKLNQVMRMILTNSINVLQGRITVIHSRIHDMEDAKLIHQRSLNFQEMSEDDKVIARKRIAALDDELRWTKERLLLVYREIGAIQAAMIKIPYDPAFRDLEDIPVPGGPRDNSDADIRQ
jgi:hypothetical protein